LKAGDIVYVESMTGEGVKAGAYTLREVPIANGAIVAIDPFTGHVLALSGGFSYGSSQFDRAMQAMRQPGSTFKAIRVCHGPSTRATRPSRKFSTPPCRGARARAAVMDAGEL